MFNEFNELEEQDPKRIREIKEDRYLPKGLINAYLDDRMNASDKKQFESLVGDHEELKEQLRVKTEKKNFIKELVPYPQISKASTDLLKVELADINDSVIGDERKSLTEKVASILDKTLFEF